MEKPKNLYHASPDKNIIIFEPRNETPRYEGEPNLVFATPFASVAAMFLVPRDLPVEICVYGDKRVIFINATENEYKSRDRGGAIYTLPVDTFETSALVGMGEVEYASKKPVRPIAKQEYDSSLNAMRQHGVGWYFVNDDTLRTIQNDPANGMSYV